MEKEGTRWDGMGWRKRGLYLEQYLEHWGYYGTRGYLSPSRDSAAPSLLPRDAGFG